MSLTLEGEGELIGHNPIAAEAGIATVLFRAGENPGNVTITSHLQTDWKPVQSY
ncbi:MAG: hypothetical protein U5K71_03360 [Gracilimonas sp.]|nr:hypothetical protein [Gracilimonas sp.]